MELMPCTHEGGRYLGFLEIYLQDHRSGAMEEICRL